MIHFFTIKEVRPHRRSINMKNKTVALLINSFICFSVILTSLSMSFPVFAQGQNEITIPFSEVGVTDLLLRGPYDSKSVSFGLPDNWQLLDGTAIELYTEVFIASELLTSSQVDTYAGATLYVYFNRRLQESISLVAGEQMLYRIPIQVQDLDSETSDGRVSISFFLDAGIDCEYGFYKTTVKISPQSAVNIIHTEKSASLDLRDLPRPIFKRDSYLPEVAKVVISDKASADELRAAYLVMAAFGRMTRRELDLEMITSDQLTSSLQQEAHLIFVGKAASLSMLNQLQMPVPLVDGKFNSQILQPDDGLVQMLHSPWNPLRVILVVGGNNDAGVVKAGQALTTGKIQTGSLPTVSLIAQVAPLESQITPIDNAEIAPSFDFTLAELGYSIQQAGVGGAGAPTGIGTQWFTYEFDLPVGRSAEEESYFDLIFSHSSLIDPERSEINLYVNGTLAGSARFNGEETSFVNQKIKIPPTLTRPGRNQIDFAAELIPFDTCTTINLSGLWMAIYPESSIHLPLTNDTVDRLQLIELRNYPYPFLSNPSVSDLTVVLAQTDIASWLSFGQIIYDLGGQATGEVVSFDVSFGGTLSEVDRQNNLILFGLPKDLLLEEELNQALPAPFEQNSNVVQIDNQTVVYRIETSKSLGYLELFPSPWDEDKTILAVLGTNSEGLTFSKQALLNSTIRTGLKGNFATLDGEQFVVVDTRSGLGLGSFPAAFEAEVVEEVVPTPDLEFKPGVSRTYALTRQIILIVLAVVVVAILVVIVLAYILRKKNLSKA